MQRKVSTDVTPRRGFLHRIGAVALGVSLPWSRARGATRAPQAGPDDWLDTLTGTHRCYFSPRAFGTGVPLIRIHNYIRTYREDYGVDGGEINAVVEIGGARLDGNLPLAFNDRMWEKYALGEPRELIDPATGAPTVRNMFYRPQPNDPVLIAPTGMQILEAGMESLQAKGATFLLCNNALKAFTQIMADSGKGTTEEIGRDLRANILPGIVIVPAVIIAAEKAQQAGLAYQRL